MEVQSRNGSKGKLISYESWDRCKIEVASGYQYYVEYSKFIRGQFKDPFIRTCYGVGYFGDGPFTSNKGTTDSKIHKVWCDIFKRSYSELEQARYPTYKGCEVDERWHCYQDFAKWYVHQRGAFTPKWAIDKDLIHKHNKIYGPDTCFLLPPEINGALLRQTRVNKKPEDLPIGVSRHSSGIGYTSTKLFKPTNTRIFFGRFETKEEAFMAYKECRENHMKGLANKYKGIIDDKAYDLLMNWEITLDD